MDADMDEARPPNMAKELALLLLLATLWGGSYTFIKLGVATIPPITLIAARSIGVPLCSAHHDELNCTGNESRWWARQAIDPIGMAV
jgi:hypothetical protein